MAAMRVRMSVEIHGGGAARNSPNLETAVRAVLWSTVRSVVIFATRGSSDEDGGSFPVHRDMASLLVEDRTRAEWHVGSDDGRPAPSSPSDHHVCRSSGMHDDARAGR